MQPDTDDDVPSGIDLRDADTAARWLAAADATRPWRRTMRGLIADVLQGVLPTPLHVLELGPGPGLLAEVVLARCEVERYTLFDFSAPMLAMCEQRIGHHPAVELVVGDFTRSGWTEPLRPPFDAVLAMQSVHEIRHKKHMPTMYTQIHMLLRTGGVLLVCDHTPPDDSNRATALHATMHEQRVALAAGGFVDVVEHARLNGLYLCSGFGHSGRNAPITPV